MKTVTKLWLGVAVLIMLSPLGLFLPARFKAGSAWGEWGADEIKNMVGYVPRGLEKISSLWHAPMPDYAIKGWEDKGLPHLSLAYIVSAVLGISVIVVAILLLGKFFSNKDA